MLLPGVARLVDAGLLDARRLKPRQEQLHEQITILATSWLRAQQVSPVRRTDEEAMRHYAKLSISLLEPYCTARGKRQLQAILNGEHDAEQLRVA